MTINAFHSSKGSYDCKLTLWCSHYCFYIAALDRFIYFQRCRKLAFKAYKHLWTTFHLLQASLTCAFTIYTLSSRETRTMQTVCISIHLGRCVTALEAVDVQAMCRHCYRKETNSSRASYLHSRRVWRHNVALRVLSLFVVSTGMSHWDQICFSDLLFRCCDIWRFTQTSCCLYPPLHVHSCLCVTQNTCAWKKGCI